MSTRRTLLGSLPALGMLSLAAPGHAAAPARPGYRVPGFELLYECDVTLTPAEEFGKTVEGTRRIIPITGGTFSGPKLRGTVVPGGADWNLQRSDGASSVEAAYYLKTDDGVLIRIVNKGVSDPALRRPATDTSEGFAMFTIPVFEAPVGRYDWLNRATFVGTLGTRKDAKNAVLIRVFQLA